MIATMFDGMQLVPLAEAARMLPKRGGRNVCVRTIWRWSSRGVKDRQGKRVVLRTTKIGHCVFTSAEWLEEFFSAISLVTTHTQLTLSQARARSIERAEQELKDRGL